MNVVIPIVGTPVYPAAQILTPEPENVAPPAGFWQQPWAQTLFPFISSLAVHAGIILVGLVLLAGVPAMRRVMAAREQQIAPSDTVLQDASLGGVDHVGIDGDPNRNVAQEDFTEVIEPNGWSKTPGTSSVPQLSGGGDGDGASDSTIGLGAGGGFGKGGGLGTGSGTEHGAGDGSAGNLAPFAAPGGGAIGVRNKFIGCPIGNARKVVFLCDATGTMINVFGDLKVELQRSITNLKAIQGFNVFFFQNDSYNALDSKGLLLATPENKRKAYNFLDESNAQGTTNPIPAIRAAFANKPDLIYVLTDGFDAVASFDDVVNEFRRLNPTHQVKVHTILVKSSEEPELEAVLKKIAEENGGKFHTVTPEEMGK